MKKILIVAGEVSGDQHGAELLRALKERASISAFGIGGDALRAAGMDITIHLEKMAFLGIGEVLRHLPFILRVHNQLLEQARAEQPDCAVLIDYPGFNMRLAGALKKQNIPVVYYISPQLWAWGRRRVHKIRRRVNKMIVIFPFEKTFYAGYGIEAEYVGHPLVDKHSGRTEQDIKTLNPEDAVLGILPGSRKQEVITLLPGMIETARKLFLEKKIRRALIVRVPHIPDNTYGQFLKPQDSFMEVTEGPLARILPQLDAAIVASGTATLETGFYQVPMVIAYHVNALTYLLGRLLVKVKYIGLANIVAGTEVAPELIQQDFTPEKAARLLSAMLTQSGNRAARQRLAIIREKLGQPGAARRAAQVILDFLEKNI